LSLSETLLWLCRIPSLIGEERELCDRVIERLNQVELARPIRRYGDSCVVPLTRGTGGPHVILAGHLDVVRTEHEGPPRIEGDRLYAPGAADMKSGLSLMLDLAEGEARPPVDVTLVFYAREEGPYAENELGPVLEQDRELLGADVAIALEPSDNKLQLGCGGSIHARVRFVGKTAHSARPWQGENAIQKSAGLLARLSATAPASQVVDGLEWKNVVSATMASGGRARNIVPDVFELNLNQRFGPGTSVEQAKSEVLALVAGDAEVEFVDVSPSAPPHRAHHLVHALSESGVLAVEPKQAWTDVARFSALGIPAANFGPGVQAQAHQKNEWTSLPALEVGQRVLRTWFTKIAASSVTALALVFALTQVGCQSSQSRKERARADAVAGKEESSLLERSHLTPALSQITRRFDPKTRVLAIDIDARRCVVQAEDPAQKGRLLEYEYKQGSFGEARLVELRGTGVLDENLFALESVRLTALPDLLGAAVEKVDSHDGRAKRILVRRNLPESEDVRVRVFVDSPRRAGHLDGNSDGQPLEGS
jgi:succinyl-diaminopimelate desuccinylase